MRKTERVSDFMSSDESEMRSSAPPTWPHNPVLLVVEMNISSVKRIVGVSKYSSRSVEWFIVAMFSVIKIKITN